MNTKLKIFAFITFTLFAVAFFTPKGNTQTKTETAGQKFKSIKVLNDMPADQMGKVMNMMSASLGVDCKFCHASNDGDYEKEGNEHKDMARTMLKMTFELNKNYFNGRPEINCNSCHKGISHPQPSFPLTPAVSQERPKQPEKKPLAEELVAKFETAIGGKENLAKINSRHIKAQRLEPDGKTTEAEEIWQKGNKILATTTYPSKEYGDYIVSEIFDGKTASKFGNKSKIELKADEAEQIKREAQILLGDLKSIYNKMDYRVLDKINGREVYWVNAVTADNQRDRLYFDVETGFLVRRSSGTPTVLGNHVFQVDYLDYKDFGGVKLPTTIKYSMPQIYWTRKILEVKNNVNITDEKFVK